MHGVALRYAALEKWTGFFALLGGALALVGIAVVEGLLLAGFRPFSPVGWPAVGLFVATAIGGIPALAGSGGVLSIYYVLNLAAPHRFADFYATPVNAVSWVIGIAILAAGIIAMRPRVLRATAAEAELRARDLYEDALRVSEQRLRLVADNVPGLIAYVDLDERYQFNNRAFEQWFGLPRDLVGRTVREVWGAERYAVIKPNVERALRGERVNYEYTFAHGGVQRQVLASYVPDLDVFGRVKGFFVLGADVTQLADARAALHAEQARLEAAIDGSSVALWDTDLRTGRVYLSDAWAHVVGAPHGDTIVKLEDLVALLHPDDLEPLRRASVEALKGTRPRYAVEHRVRAKNGEWKWVLSRGRVTERDPQSGRALRMVGTNVDITDRKRIEEAIESVAQTDALTGLANRLRFMDRLRLALARSRRHGTSVALLYLDLDRFKDINDRLGHSAGDTLLKDFAMRLRASVRASDTVARFGGDEFVILLEDVKEREHAVRVADKIVHESRQPLRIEGSEVVATASVGVAYSAEGVDEERLLRSADAALYQAKAAGRDGYRVAV